MASREQLGFGQGQGRLLHDERLVVRRVRLRDRRPPRRTARGPARGSRREADRAPRLGPDGLTRALIRRGTRVRRDAGPAAAPARRHGAAGPCIGGTPIAESCMGGSPIHEAGRAGGREGGYAGTPCEAGTAARPAWATSMSWV